MCIFCEVLILCSTGVILTLVCQNVRTIVQSPNELLVNDER